MNFEPFFERCKKFPEKDRKFTNAFCAAVVTTFDNDDFKDVKKLSSLFYGKRDTLSRAKFHHYKSYVIAFYQWLLEEGFVDKEWLEFVKEIRYEDIDSNEQLQRYYFDSLDSALKFVRDVGKSCGLTGENDLLQIKAIIVLAWNGVESQEMLELRKTQLNKAEKSITISSKESSRTILLEEKYYDVIQRCADTDYQISYAGQKQALVPSVYLFRSNRSDRLTMNGLKSCIKRFNLEARPNQSISVEELKKNGLFYKVLLNANNVTSVNSLIEELGGYDRQVSSGYAALYKKWKEKFYL